MKVHWIGAALLIGCMSPSASPDVEARTEASNTFNGNTFNGNTFNGNTFNGNTFNGTLSTGALLDAVDRASISPVVSDTDLWQGGPSLLHATMDGHWRSPSGQTGTIKLRIDGVQSAQPRPTQPGGNVGDASLKTPFGLY